MKSKKALIVAHHHPLGRVRSDTLELINGLAAVFQKIIFVSTNLMESEISFLPKEVLVITRPNHGYDFYSYRHGLLVLKEKYPGLGIFEEIFLMNTSFLSVNSKLLIEKYFEPDLKLNCLGLTKSTAISEHIQSYLIGFGKEVFEQEEFIGWWEKMKPIDDRQQVIFQYEVGLSRLLLSLGFKLDVVYQHWQYIPEELKKKFVYSDEVLLGAINMRYGALHYHWRQLYEQFGVLKLEVLKSNPEKVNLSHINQSILTDKKLLKFVSDGLLN